MKLAYDTCLKLSRPGQEKKYWKEKKIVSLSYAKAYWYKEFL